MASLQKELSTSTPYVDQKFPGTEFELRKALEESCTVYVGNLSFYTTEEQLEELFSKVGNVKKIIIGLDRNTKTPCGFAFVEYYLREHAENCVRFLSGTRLDDRLIRSDLDWGFMEGRQYGRGKGGGQVRDEYRTDYDPGRGGYGRQQALELQRKKGRGRDDGGDSGRKRYRH